jgi:hypothetical protein
LRGQLAPRDIEHSHESLASLQALLDGPVQYTEGRFA